jgi:hypothetical protein
MAPQITEKMRAIKIAVAPDSSKARVTCPQ